MQVGPPTGQDLAIIDRYRPVTGHDAEQLRLLSPFPATDAGANRVGHRNRLTRAACTARSASRLLSQDGSRVLMGLKHPTFAVSRGALAGWEVQPPLWLEGPTDPDGPTIQERIPNALQGPQRLAVDAF
jgi:hypothetical protein